MPRRHVPNLDSGSDLINALARRQSAANWQATGSLTPNETGRFQRSYRCPARIPQGMRWKGIRNECHCPTDCLRSARIDVETDFMMQYKDR